MRKTKFLARFTLLVLLFTVGSIAATAAVTHYAKVTVKSTGNGKVYVTDNSYSQPNDEDYTDKMSCNHSNIAKEWNYSFYNLPNANHVLDGWYYDAACTDLAFRGGYNKFEATTDEENPPFYSFYAKFVNYKSASKEHGVNVTSWIANPVFASDGEGWDNDGVSFVSNVNNEGNKVYNNFSESAEYSALSQVLSNLPIGKYVLSVDVTQDLGEKKDVHKPNLYVKDGTGNIISIDYPKSDVTARQTVSVEFDVTELSQEITIGYDFDGILQENISQIYSFSLMYYGDGCEHDFSSKTLSDTPDENGFYYYVCANDPEHVQYDVKVIKDYDGAGTNLELKMDAEGRYSVNSDVNFTDDSNVGDLNHVYFTANNLPTYTRKGVKNQWGTIVVPFEVANTSEYEFYTLTGVAAGTVELTKLKASKKLPAGTPAIFRLAKAPKTSCDLTVQATSNAVAIVKVPTAAEVDGLTPTGSYGVKNITDDSGYIISNNAFWSIDEVKGENNVWLAPFRSYLAGEVDGEASVLSINIDAEEDDAETAVEAIKAITSGQAEYYDINGCRINELQEGINIIKNADGKSTKVIIK